MKIDLTDKVVLVTGGSRGIGKATVEALSAAGATIALHFARNSEIADSLAKAAGNGSRAFQANFERPEEVAALIPNIIEVYGRIDVLVNNAGIAEGIPMDASTDTWIESWERTQRVNQLAPALLSREVIPYMAKQGGGRLIHIASRAAFRGDTPDYLAYAASKGGMVAMSRSLARAYGKQGIVSFVVAPGFTRTEMAQQFIDQYGEEIAMKDFALDRLTEPEDVAPAVVMFASGLIDHATGSTLDVNGGSYVR